MGYNPHTHTHTHIYNIYITHMSSHVIQWGYFIYLIQLFLFSPIYQVECTPDGVSGSYDGFPTGKKCLIQLDSEN